MTQVFTDWLTYSLTHWRTLLDRNSSTDQRMDELIIRRKNVRSNSPVVPWLYVGVWPMLASRVSVRVRKGLPASFLRCPPLSADDQIVCRFRLIISLTTTLWKAHRLTFDPIFFKRWNCPWNGYETASFFEKSLPFILPFLSLSFLPSFLSACLPPSLQPFFAKNHSRSFLSKN